MKVATRTRTRTPALALALAATLLTGCGSIPATVDEMKVHAKRRASYTVQQPLPKVFEAIVLAQRVCHESPGVPFIEPPRTILTHMSENQRSADVSLVLGGVSFFHSFLLTAEGDASTKVELLDRVVHSSDTLPARLKTRVEGWLVGDRSDCGRI